MRDGNMLPKDACHHALKVVYEHFPTTKAGIICMNSDGEFGAAAIGFPYFSYTVMSKHYSEPHVITVAPSTYA